MLYDTGIWLPTKDGDPWAFSMYRRHYAAKKNPHPAIKQFMGPGQTIVLMTLQRDALFAWRKFIDDSGQQGVNCSVFRNEGPLVASVMILEAEEHAWKKWPGERLYTYVDPTEVKGTCPGYCFRRAKWKRCGETQRGLLIFDKWPI